MKDNRRAHKEKFPAQLEKPNAQIALFKTRANLDESKTGGGNMGGPEDWRGKGPGRSQNSLPRHDLTVQMNKTTGHVANSHARSLAEAVILQSIEDLWNPVCKRGSLVFFEGEGFELCSEVAGLSYIKQLVMLRMLAHAGPKTSLRNLRKSPLQINVKDVQTKQYNSITRSVM